MLFIFTSFLKILWSYFTIFTHNLSLNQKEVPCNYEVIIVDARDNETESGIDLILKSFSKYAKDHPDAKLTIKAPDYSSFTNVVYTFQNDISKHSKLFSSNQKIELDRRKLMKKIESKVTFILILDDSFIDFVTSPFLSIRPYVQE